ncbi:DMT family transporter, partial [Planktotalea sp.]|uniref:DMT family transporter n=1 Tax=Planktotalea sp. TaxID=2029877 RepID=UPI003298D234
MTDTFQTRRVGVIILLLSAVTFSCAGIFTKAVSADAWSVIFWRGLSSAIFALVFLALRSKVREEWAWFGWPAVIATVLMASGTAAFIPAFKLTSVANVALIWATAPFVTAFLAWLAIRERPERIVVLCSGFALIGVAITVSGSFGSSTLMGDLLAFWMTLMMALTMVLYRMWPDTPTVLPTAFSSLVLLVPAWLLSEPLHVTQIEVGVLIVFGLVFAVAAIALVEGARRVPAAQAALISILETPLAPIWALLILSEVPSFEALIGGVIIIVAVFISQVRT